MPSSSRPLLAHSDPGFHSTSFDGIFAHTISRARNGSTTVRAADNRLPLVTDVRGMRRALVKCEQQQRQLENDRKQERIL